MPSGLNQRGHGTALDIPFVSCYSNTAMKHEYCVAEKFNTSSLVGIRGTTAAYSYYYWYYSLSARRVMTSR